MPVTVAAKDVSGAFTILNRLANRWNTPTVRVYSETDPISKELGLFLSAQSTQTEVRYRAEAEGDDDISPVAVTPKKMKAAIGKDGLVLVQSDPDKDGNTESLTVNDEDDVTVTVKPALDLAALPAPIEEHISGVLYASQTVAIADLYDRMEWVARSISSDEARPHLASLRVEAEAEHRFAAPGVMVCTDRNRLHLSPSPLSPPGAVLIYSESVATILAVMKHQAKKEQYVVISWGPTGGSVSCGPWEVFFRLNTETRFPPYDKVIPTQTYGSAAFDPRRAVKAIDKAKNSVDEHVPSCDLSFRPGKVVFSARDMEGQGVDVAFPAVTNVDGFLGGIVINMEYFKQAINVPGGEVVLSVSDESLAENEYTQRSLLVQHELGTAINMPMRK
jgi:hypothetical protein